MNVLFVSPHPDDVEIGCAGLLQVLKAKGSVCSLLVLAGEGDLQMAHSSESVKFLTRRDEQRVACDLLDVDTLIWGDVAPASRFDTAPLREGVSAIEKALNDTGADLLVIPLPSYNQDHQYTFEAAMAATRPGLRPRLSIMAYEQATQSHAPHLITQFISSVYVPLNEAQLNIKIRSIEAHQSQMGGRGDTLVGVPGATALARLRGLECGVKFAERLVSLRSVFL